MRRDGPQQKLFRPSLRNVIVLYLISKEIAEGYIPFLCRRSQVYLRDILNCSRFVDLNLIFSGVKIEKNYLPVGQTLHLFMYGL